jgi:hypothetical protein
MYSRAVRSLIWRLSLILVASGFSSTIALRAESVTLAWNASLTPNISSYVLYYGTASRTYDQTLNVGVALTGTIPNLLPGITYYFAVTARNELELESDYSDEITYTTPGTSPNQPPTLDSISDISLPANAGPQTVPLSGISSGAAAESQSLTVTATHDNPALLGLLSVDYSSPAATGNLTLIPLAGATGSAIITVTVKDGGSVNNTVIRRFAVTIRASLANAVFVEAEAGTLTTPMTAVADASAWGGWSVLSLKDGEGTAAFSFNVPITGNYRIWCRIKSDSPSADSFFARMDDGIEQIFPTITDGSYSAEWQWQPLRSWIEGDPWIFSLAGGPHQLTLRCRESRTWIDALFVTSDGSFVPPASPPKMDASNTPVVDAGQDARVLLPQTLRLSGSVTDDGLPVPPGRVFTSWSMVSGPGTVVFDASSSPTGTVRFGVPGQYVLRLTATDGESAASDDLTVNVIDATGPAVSAETLEALDARSFTLLWQTDEPALCQMEFGSITNLDSFSPMETSPTTFHRVTFTNLHPATVYYYWIRSMDDAGNVSLTEIAPLSTPPLNIFAWAAESGIVSSPMNLAANDTAMDGRYVVSPAGTSGSVQFPIFNRVLSTYRLWCRVWTTSPRIPLFGISVDGGPEDTFDIPETGWKTGWSWVAVNGRNASEPLALNPRTFTLDLGLHEFSFKALGAPIGIDELILSNDPQWTPSIQGSAPFLTITAISTERVVLTWTDAISNEEGFSIQVFDGRAYVEIGRVPANTTRFEHVGLPPAGGTLYYRVFGFSASDRTDYSNVAAVIR